MQHHNHRQTYKPAAPVSAFWSILAIGAAAGVITVMALYAAGVLTQ